MQSFQFQVARAFHVEIVVHSTKRVLKKPNNQPTPNHKTSTQAQTTQLQTQSASWPDTDTGLSPQITDLGMSLKWEVFVLFWREKKRWHSENSPELREQCPLHNGHASAQTHPWHCHRQSIACLSYAASGFSSKTLATLAAQVQQSTQAVGFTHSITIFKPSLSAQHLPRDFKCLCK